MVKIIKINVILVEKEHHLFGELLIIFMFQLNSRQKKPIKLVVSLVIPCHKSIRRRYIFVLFIIVVWTNNMIVSIGVEKREEERWRFWSHTRRHHMPKVSSSLPVVAESIFHLALEPNSLSLLRRLTSTET